MVGIVARGQIWVSLNALALRASGMPTQACAPRPSSTPSCRRKAAAVSSSRSRPAKSARICKRRQAILRASRLCRPTPACTSRALGRRARLSPASFSRHETTLRSGTTCRRTRALMVPAYDQLIVTRSSRNVCAVAL